ncbi:MAG: NBR1-Ig-like domain-containing protein [Anaerolineae bacterium]
MIPRMRQCLFTILGLVFLLSACESVGLGNDKPIVVITAPASGAQFRVGQEIPITSTSTDAQGVVRVELLVDSIIVRTDPSPVAQGQAQFQVIQGWKASGEGTHTVTVRSYNSQGMFGEAGIVVTVYEDQAAAPTATVVISTPIPINTFVAIATDVIPTLAPTLTPLPTVPPTVAPPTNGPGPSTCVPNAAFVADATIPDYTVVAPGTAFTKAWRVQNNGNCPWDASYAVMWTGGYAQLASQAVFPIIPTALGSTIDVAVPMTAPTAPGYYQSVWRLRDSLGNQFGPTLTVVIQVAYPTATPNPYVPTAVPLPGAPTIAYFACNPCTITAGQSTMLSWGTVTGAASASIDQGIGGVATPGSLSLSPNVTTTYILTATGPGGTVQANITVTVNPAASFAGNWFVNLGTMNLAQNGSSVNGTFSDQLRGVTGSVAGNVSGNVLDGTWTNNLSQTGPVHWVVNGNQLNGYWNGNTGNKWCGARSGSEFPNGCSFDGHWNMLSGFVCSPTTMDLRRVDMTVTGNFCGNLTISGNLTFASNVTILTGNWTNPGLGGGPFTFYLSGYSALQFSGHSSSNPWCGWRNNSSQPIPCNQ